MKHDDIIDLIEPTPLLKQRRCKILSRIIAFFLSYGSIILALGIWYFYTLLYAAAAFIIGYLVIGIIRSKMRNSVIPRRQQEYHYTDRAIADWFVAKELLCQ